MKKKRLIIRTVVLLLLGLAIGYTIYANFSKDEIQTATVGETAPDFALIDLNGEKHQLSEYRGKGVLLNFWATWCPPCEREMPYLNSLYETYKEKGVQILAVNVGESEISVNDFVRKHNLQFPVLIDKNQDVLTAYGVDPLPVTFLIDKKGKIVKVHTGEIISEDVAKEMLEKIRP